MDYGSGPVRLRTNLGRHKVTAGILDGTVSSDLVQLDICGPKVANEGFKPMIREGSFQAGELAIVSYLQARAAGKPLVLLPAVVMGGPLHHCIRIDPSHGRLAPRDIEGRLVGTRTYTQTTAVWVRGILQHDYDVDLARVRWGVADGSHLAEYTDPDNCQALPAGSLEGLLAEGAIAAAVLSPQAPADARAATLIPDAAEAAVEWSRQHGVVPINHMFVVDQRLSEQRPDVIREIWRMLVESGQPQGAGVEMVRKPLEMIIRFATEQKIIEPGMTVGDLFDERTQALLF